jgi:hypothetical protein
VTQRLHHQNATSVVPGHSLQTLRELQRGFGVLERQMILPPGRQSFIIGEMPAPAPQASHDRLGDLPAWIKTCQAIKCVPRFADSDEKKIKSLKVMFGI